MIIITRGFVTRAVGPMVAAMLYALAAQVALDVQMIEHIVFHAVVLQLYNFVVVKLNCAIKKLLI